MRALIYILVTTAIAQNLTDEMPTSYYKAQPERIRITLNDLPAPYTTHSAVKSPRVVPIPVDAHFNVPPGFHVQVFADNLDRPRWLAHAPHGGVLVTETRLNRITLLEDEDNDGVAEKRRTWADRQNGLNIPFGMTTVYNKVKRRYEFIVGNTNEVRAYPINMFNKTQRIEGIGERRARLPGYGYNQHWTRNVVRSPDGRKLYVTVGSRTNVGVEPLPRASIQVMNIDGSEQQTWGSGLRNPVGVDFHPITGELYTTVNERDGLGDDLVPDYFTRVQQGDFYGWPYTYLAPNLTDPRHINHRQQHLTRSTKTPDVLFQAHSAALGLQFYNHTAFPARYRNGAFVAFRGSWNRNQGTGYNIVFVPFDHRTNRPMGYYEDFVTGFLIDPVGPTVWGRPVGLLAMSDGSVLFTEEMNNRIYR